MTTGGEEEEVEVEEVVVKDEVGAVEDTDVAMDVGDAR